MEIIKSTDAIKYKNADSCVAFEYETGEGAIKYGARRNKW